MFYDFVLETPVQVFSSKFFDIFKNIFFTEHLPMTASKTNKSNMWLFCDTKRFVWINFNELKVVLQSNMISKTPQTRS